MSIAKTESLLLVKPGSFGDIIHALPCAAAIKAHRPDTRLAWLVDERWTSLLEGNPHIDETVIFPRQRFRGLSGKLASIPWAFGLRRLRPDIALDLQGLLRSGLMSKLSGARRIIGLSDAREGARFFFTETASVNTSEHSVLRYLRSLETLGLPKVSEPEFWLPEGNAPAKFKPDSPFVLLHPFARGQGKSLSANQVASFCQALAPRKVIVAGMGMAPSLPKNGLDALNRTSISEMIWLIRHASFVVSVDSGPMHIAAAVQAPLLSIHTWSDPRLVGPFNAASWIWQGGNIRRQDIGAPQLPPAQTPGDSDIAEIADFARTHLR